MKTDKSGLDTAFLEKQRRELQRLRANLTAASDTATSEEAQIRTQRAGETLELEEDAQGLDSLEREDNLIRRNALRLERVNRALQKIDEGTYGLSDESGKPIPRERLESLPDALYTVSEERSRERDGS